MSPQRQPPSVSLILGRSAPVQQVRAKALKWGPRNCTVGAVGPTGAGKNLLAKELHRIRGRGRFVRVSLSDVPPALLHSELFGHVKGSFTDAKQDRAGAVQEAGDGTLLIDELQDAGPEAQRMLRDIADREPVSRLGEHRPYVGTCRLIVGSQLPLMELVRRRGFREDLAYRLMVEELVVPPLAEHLEDLPDLVPAIVAEVAVFEGIEPLAVSEAAMAALGCHAWPGNIRELQRALTRALIEAQGCGAVEPWHLPAFVRVGASAWHADEVGRGMPSREELAAILARLSTMTAVAAYYGKCARTISRWVQKFGLDRAA